jgi:hypothetical protein
MASVIQHLTNLKKKYPDLTPVGVGVDDFNNPDPLTALLSGKVTTMPTYTDRDVVCAFNSCLDMAKWKDLPDAVRERFRHLLQHNRIKMVCFSNELGVGLRVYQDQDCMNVTFDDGDECAPGEGGLEKGDKAGRVDIAGSWMRCPGSEWKVTEEFLVMDGFGRKFVGPTYGTEDAEEDDPYDWRQSRASAKRFNKEMAEAVAAEVKGVVVKP